MENFQIFLLFLSNVSIPIIVSNKKLKNGLRKKPCINPFHAIIVFLYPPNTSEKLWLSDVFRGYRNKALE